MPSNNPSCPDCGSAPVNHTLESFDNWMEIITNPVLLPLDRLRQWIFPATSWIGDYLAPVLMEFFVLIKLARWIDEPEDKISVRAKCFWEEAKKRGIKMREWRLFNLPNETFLAEWKKQKCIFQGLPRPNGPDSDSLIWMDNKAEMKKNFLMWGIPVAKGRAVFSVKKAIFIFNNLAKPVIVKPASGSRSRHTTIHIETEKELIEAFNKAKMICPLVMVEEELQGSVYRAIVVGGKLEGVLRRDPAAVEGDGIHTVRELVEIENKKPLRQGPLFHYLVADEATESELKRQNLNWDSVPMLNRIVALGTKTSRGVGGALVDVTDIAHPDNIKLFTFIAEKLKDSLVGIDFIISDIKKSWQEQPRSGVIECNSMPFIDLHHYPLQGTPRNVAGALWDIIFR
ncbi:MAG: UDP-N-acetylmuramyl tripeptide synthase [Candidatus Magasanikbacteria bacterium GW2011_GWC2_34_16]|uniref:UDP-N-acetylmuramyl tripeptide synthase n=2 Tax=Candidatus Magasanikiibacteriota TaxID=1752731 RepID=A0A0G0KKN7_9BACT|nr:MAG: UDP-N-acetylmuramyl tripeptide synthase [Candidatus Magasanikbacteria bacterium GW2011_GWC2_34_16]KKQ41136.1 MAG: UDP-N-acetylmuramyl tripeptide synthase [Candidatus Magasanikbacteria bacterium GW2011_GWA2_37_8]